MASTVHLGVVALADVEDRREGGQEAELQVLGREAQQACRPRACLCGASIRARAPTTQSLGRCGARCIRRVAQTTHGAWMAGCRAGPLIKQARAARGAGCRRRLAERPPPAPSRRAARTQVGAQRVELRVPQHQRTVAHVLRAVALHVDQLDRAGVDGEEDVGARGRLGRRHCALRALAAPQAHEADHAAPALLEVAHRHAVDELQRGAEPAHAAWLSGAGRPRPLPMVLSTFAR